MVIETWLKTDRKKPIVVKALQGNLFSADNGANLIGVEVVEDGSPATLSGGVIGYVVRADGATVVVNGTLSDNKATVTLSASCYTVVGPISIVIKVDTTTVGACTGYVYRSSTDAIVDPGHIVPSLQELLAQIENCRAATTAANGAASSANTAASNANEKATLANNAASNANEKAGLANSAAQTANTAAGKIDNMTASATGLPPTASPTVTITEVDGHKHIAFGLVKGDPGDATIDDTAGEGDTTKVWSADKLSKLEAKTDSKAPAIYSDIDYTPLASFSDGADDMPVKDLKVAIEPVQEGEGDPSPENVRPITGWTGAKVTRTGKNLLLVKYPGRANNGITYTTNTDGTISVSGTATDYSYFAPNYGFSQQYMTLLPRGTYSLKSSGTTSSINVYGAFYDVNGNYKGTTSSDTGDGTIFNVSEDFVWFSPQIFITSGTSVSMNMEIMLELGSTATDYEPYQGNTYDITFPSEAGTVYGGTLDVTSGVLTVDRLNVDLGSLDWQSWDDGVSLVFNAPFPGKTHQRANADCISSTYKYRSAVAHWPDLLNGEMTGSVQNDRIYFRNTAYNDNASFKAGMSGVQVVYTLAEPITYQLTPQEVRTLLGQNNVWADTGDVSVTYPADTKAYIDNQIASTRKLIAGIETGFTASKAYSVGDMLIIGNDLYKVSASIASGATITVGTNVTKTTVAEQLIALANA